VTAIPPSLLTAWPQGVDVLVLPSTYPDEPNTVLYPAGTLELVKRLRLDGVCIEYLREDDEGEEVASFSIDAFLPYLLFAGKTVSAWVIAKVLDHIARRVSGDTKDTTLHIKCGRVDGDKVEQFTGDGPGKEVLEAMEKFLNT
jgi:hypothetical protein